MQYWLIKTEPEDWSWEEQVKCGNKGAEWNGVRNFQATKNLKNMKIGDKCFFYHTGKSKGIMGIAVIALQCRKDDQKTLNTLNVINDKETYYCIEAERALLEAIGGDCDTAIGGLAKLSNGKIFLKSELFSNNGEKKFEFESSGHFKEAKEIGYKVGKELLKKAGSNFTVQGN